jgi:lauroyl/myristoyl acyltransferase
MRTKAREWLTWTDLTTAMWLVAGLPAAFLSRNQRWRICQAFARLAIRGRRARDARQRIELIGGLSPATADRVVHWLYTARLAANLDVVRSVLREPDVRITCSGLDALEAALSAGRGAVLWVSDFAGAGDVTKIALARARFRVTHLSRTEHGFSQSVFGIRFLNPIRLRFERAWLDGRVVFDRGNPASAMLELSRRLRANGIVSITASAHEGRTLVRADFFRGTIQLATGALRLAALVEAPLIPVFTIPRSGEPGAFDVIVEPPLQFPAGMPEKQAMLSAATEYLDRLELHVTRQPESWVGWRRNDHLT